MEDLHLAAQSWSYRVPSPPRLTVPPPALDHKGAPDLRIDPSKELDFESSGFANSEFLKTVTYGDFMTRHSMYEWKYEQRWTGQKILPFLFLGPITAARSRDFLLDNGITMLLAVRDTKSAHARLLGSKAAQELNIPYSTVDTAGNQELIAAFPRGIEIINTHLSAMYQQSQNMPTSDRGSTPGRVLVFCETGNERSAAMVVAYIMAMYSMDVIKAIQLIQAQRFAVAFDDPTKSLLQTYDSILCARRDVIRSSKQDRPNADNVNLSAPIPIQSHSAMTRKPSKRTLDDANDDDVGMDGSELWNGNEKREGAAPFFDHAGL
ncbi:MAG: hypothetical protein Q9225_006722 [Loekoesia sp. 1 TL-2023]